MKVSSVWKGLLMVCALQAIAQAEAIRVGVSVLPLEGLVQAIGGELVEVRALQEEGDNCSVFEPRPSAVYWLSQCDLFFRTGVGFETAILAKIEDRFRGLTVIDLREGLELLETHAHEGHACAHCGGAEPSMPDPHVWLDPLSLRVMADQVAEGLAALQPEQAAVFRERAEVFKAKATAVHSTLEAQLAPLKGRAFYIYHPALGYFARRYGLEQMALAETASGPSPRELYRLMKEARASGAKVVFVQPQEDQRQAQLIAEAIGGHVKVIDPMRTDWEANLLEIGAALEMALQRE